jgi:UDP-2,3-diacylglucosamine pyrophosphatase LpxH
MKKWRTIIMSDLHLGARQSQTDKILKFLEQNESETLILNGDIIYEVKPSTLLEYKDNDLKINKGLELYGDKYKVITEKEAPYIEKTKILELIETGIVRVNKKSLKILEKYKH